MGLITDVPGISVGHFSDISAGTGCSLILFDRPSTGAIDLSGGGTSTRQIDSLLPHGTYGKINAILLTGGSTYGLNASDGVLRFLEENGVGLETKNGTVIPSVPSAVIYDLGIGSAGIRPDAEMGYNACLDLSDSDFKIGTVGAGTGATIGKMAGVEKATKGGVGSESYVLPDGVSIGVFIVVNAFGDVYAKDGDKIIAGARKDKNSKEFLNTLELFKQGAKKDFEPYSSTTLCVVATNARFNKQELTRISRLSHTGICRVINPVNTMADGDIVFAVSCGNLEGDANSIGIIAADLVSDSIIKAVKSASSLLGTTRYTDLVSI